jgi:hypothetical protein
MTKYSINIGGMSDADSEALNSAVNNGEPVVILGDDSANSDGEDFTSKAANKRVTIAHQYGEHNYQIDRAEGLHIGEVITGKEEDAW